jgi:hypothetical protein
LASGRGNKIGYNLADASGKVMCKKSDIMMILWIGENGFLSGEF